MDPVRLKFFKSGNSRALRIPKTLGLENVDEVMVFREGEALVLKPADTWPEGFFDMEPIPDFSVPAREGGLQAEIRRERIWEEG